MNASSYSRCPSSGAHANHGGTAIRPTPRVVAPSAARRWWHVSKQQQQQQQQHHYHRRGCCIAAASASGSWDEEATALADLRAQLNAALAAEDYKLAARLRDAIQQRSTDVRLAVEDANTRFYNAFRSGNIKEMSSVWGEGEHVSVIHPGAECIAGREQVMESWRSILAGVRPRAFRLDLEDVRVWANDNSGFVTCVEVIDADDSMGRVCATNVFEKQGDNWVIVLHQGGPAPPKRRVKFNPL